MSLKTCRVLHTIAFVLFALAFLLAILAIPFQKGLISLYTSDPDVLSHFNFPWGTLLRCFFWMIPALLYLILVYRRMAPGGTKAVVIVLAILSGLQMLLFIPVLETWITALISKEGMIATMHYNSLNGAASFLTSFLLIPAEILMFLSMGGFCGKDTRS